MKKKFILSIILLILAGFAIGVKSVIADKPVGITQFINPEVFSWNLGINFQGDNEMATAWASNSLLPQFADPNGLPVLSILNDGNMGGCGGNIGIFQISKLPAIGVTASTSNMALTAENCMSSYSGNTSPNGTWNDTLSWKGAVMAFRNNRLLAYFYRQDNAGTVFSNASLVISPDAGQNWIDYGRYNMYSISGASWSSGTVTLTTASSTASVVVGQKIYVHDVLPSGYNGEFTITATSTNAVSFALVSNPGSYSSGGAFGPLASDGSAPLGPLSSGYNMMWPVSNGPQMKTPAPISYGQDGNYPTGVDSACDPTVYVCGTSGDMRGGLGVYLWRVPVGQEMDKTQYQWYTCSGYVALWTVTESVCDGNKSSSWTSTMSSATILMYQIAGSARPEQLYHLKYLPSHHSYLTASISRLGGRPSFYWSPHPWGPFYAVTSSECTSSDGNSPQGCPGFFSLMDYGENIISTTPSLTQIRIAGKSGFDQGNGAGSPEFWTVEAGLGRLPFMGIARRAEYMGISGQNGMGHRFTNGVESGAIPMRGNMAVPSFNSNIYCKVVTTSHTMLSGPSALTNYPLTVSLTDTNLKSTSNGGSVNNPLGYDIRFFSDCSGSGSQLNWEIEKYDPTTGTIVAHVLRPTFPASGNVANDDTIGLYYGGDYTSFQSTPSAVWNSSYVAVYHLKDGVTLSGLDSTSNGNNLSVGFGTAVAVTGMVDGGVSIAPAGSGGNQWAMANTSPTGFPSGSSTRTLEGWFKMGANIKQFVFGWGDFGATGHNFSLLYDNNALILDGKSTSVSLGWTYDTNWHHFAATVPSGTTNSSVLIYLDGVQQSVSADGGTLATTLGEFRLGSNPGYNGGCGPCEKYTGLLDEVRVSNVARSLDWIKTEYRNQNTPGTYLSEGSASVITSGSGQAIPQYKIDWWADVWDHGGQAADTGRPYFRDLISGGSKYLTVYHTQSGASPTIVGFAGAATSSTTCDGAGSCLMSSGSGGLMQPNFTDSATFQGNSSWTIIATVNVGGPYGPVGNSSNATPVMELNDADSITCQNNNNCQFAADGLGVYMGVRTTNDVCVRWGTGSPTDICTSGAAFANNAGWVTIAVTATADLTGYPKITIAVGNAGTMTEYGGVGMATSPNGTSAGGLTKTCTSCSAPPNIGATHYWIGWNPTNFGTFDRSKGDMGVYSGAVPGQIIRKIYKTLKMDWARVGRGTL
jgi:hypothetical protein